MLQVSSLDRVYVYTQLLNPQGFATRYIRNFANFGLRWKKYFLYALGEL